MQYYIGINGVPSGPFDESVIREKIASGAFAADALCWTEGWSEWRPLASVFPMTAPSLRPPSLPSSAFNVRPATPPPAIPSKNAATSGLAITSLVLGVVGLILFFTSIPAVICGHLACSNIKRSNGAQKGRGLAITGLVLGYLVISLIPVGLMAAMAIPAFQKVRAVSQEKAIINNLRQLDAAAEQFFLETNARQATYANLVGSGANHYIRELRPVTGEDYTQLIIRPSDREISVTTVQGRVITHQRHYTANTPSFTPAPAP